MKVTGQEEFIGGVTIGASVVESDQEALSRKIHLRDERELSDRIKRALGASLDEEIEETQKEIKVVGAFLLKNRNSEKESVILEMMVAEKKSIRLGEKFEELISKREVLAQKVAEFVGNAGDWKMAESMLNKITPLSNALKNAVSNGYQPAEQLNRFVDYEVQRYKDIQQKFERACKSDPDLAKAAGL